MSKFTEAETTRIVKVYTEAVKNGENYDELTMVVKTIAISYEKSVQSIRGVLVAAKVYVVKPKADAEGDSMDKEAIVKALSIVTGKVMPSFKNASKKDLTTLWEWIVSTSDRKEADA